MTTSRRRLDLLLVERGLAPSREKAQALILAGAVCVDGRPAAKPGSAVPTEAALEIAAPLRWVSRGGFKLEAALRSFSIDVAGRICLDIGASTGGFTHCLLDHGAARVHAVDVGHGQLDWSLRQDPRVVVHERLNARYLTPADIGDPIDLAVCDVSFISATLLVEPMARLLTPQGSIVVLVKPQFELARLQVGRGGIVRDPALHQAACSRVRSALENLHFTTQLIESPITGAEGNREFLLYAKR